MKNITHFIKPLFKAVFLTGVLFSVSSCGGYDQKPEDTKEVAEDQNDAKFNTAQKEKDAQFLVNAAEINLEEIMLGQLAQQKGSMKDVKELGKMMEDAHNKSLKDLTGLAGKKSVTLPVSSTDNAQQAYKKLNDESGHNFDKAYCDLMVNGHKDAVAAFEKKSTDEAVDADIRQWATSMLPTLRAHLDHSMVCQKKCEDMK